MSSGGTHTHTSHIIYTTLLPVTVCCVCVCVVCCLCMCVQCCGLCCLPIITLTVSQMPYACKCMPVGVCGHGLCVGAVHHTLHTCPQLTHNHTHTSHTVTRTLQSSWYHIYSPHTLLTVCIIYYPPIRALYTNISIYTSHTPLVLPSVTMCRILLHARLGAIHPTRTTRPGLYHISIIFVLSVH